MKRTELNNQKALGLLTAFAGSNLTNFFRRFFAESGKSKFKQFMACCMLFVFTCSCTRCEPCENNESFGSKPLPEGVTGQELNDMFLKHEGVPHGVPEGYGWKYVPVIDVGAKMPSDFKKIIQWGQFYADQSLPSPEKTFPNIRVHIRNMKLMVLQNDNTWKLVEDTDNFWGALYVADFVGDANKPADIRKEPDGGISAQAGSGFCFHFGGAMRDLTPNSIKGVFVVCQARLIGVQGDQNPKYLLNVGADYWRDAGLPHSGVWTVPPGTPYNCEGIGIGRFKYVTTEWQNFIFHTFSKSEINSMKIPL